MLYFFLLRRELKIEKSVLFNLYQLAKFNIEEDKLSEISSSLDRLVEYIDAVNSVDTENIAPLYSVNDVTNPLREDKPQKSMSKEDLLLNAKESENGFITVFKTV